MGTLDDAIREHLELKKRAGASEEELQRLESEAFGPIRREAVAPAAAALEESAGEHPLPDPEEPEEGTERRDFDLPPDVEPGHDPAPEAPPSSPSPAPDASRSWLDEDDDAPAEHGQATSEFTAAEAAAAEGAPRSDYVAPDEEGEEGEDLLEETPDFLQETPEHDRLWFEQRPPRDFDFDE